jgi:hypothetical protein
LRIFLQIGFAPFVVRRNRIFRLKTNTAMLFNEDRTYTVHFFGGT